jgi:exonuclease SbcD
VILGDEKFSSNPSFSNIPMFRVFHTADWHLGQIFHHYERNYEHQRFLAWLLHQIGHRKPDVLIIAGDVFDSVNPSGSAQLMYYDFLRKAADTHPGLQIVLTAGNHDAASRIEAPAPVLRSFRIHAVGNVDRTPEAGIDYSKFLIPVKDSEGTVRAIVLAVPYLRFADLPVQPEAQSDYTAGLRAFYKKVTQEACLLRDEKFPGAHLIGMGHCHLLEGTESRESERRLVVGGLEALTADAFPADLSYVALGHLHKPQTFQNGRVQYSGSPIPLSFTEREYKHRILEIDFDDKGLSNVCSLEIPRAVPLISLPDGRAVSMDDLERLLRSTDFGSVDVLEQQPFLEVRYLDDGPDPTRRNRIETALENKPVRLASTKMEPLKGHAESAAAGGTEGLGDIRSIDAMDVLMSAYRERHAGSEPEPDMLRAFQEILTEVRG